MLNDLELEIVDLEGKGMRKRISLMENLFGDTVQVKILEAFLEGGKVDVTVRSVVEEAGVSKSRAYEVIRNLKGKKIIISSRRIKNKQLYILNYRNKVVKDLSNLFKSLIRINFS